MLIKPSRWGFDKRKAHLSTLICSGQITRDEALKMLLRPIYDAKLLLRDKKFFLEKLGISEEEFNNFIKLPKNKHENFLTDKGINSVLRIGGKILRKIIPSMDLY